MIVRVDDFPHGSDKGIARDDFPGAFWEFHKAMDGIPYLLGCVPWFTTDAHLVELARHTNVEVGVHGFKHTRGEFSGSDIAALTELVQRGRKVLAGSVPVFVPPFNWVSVLLLEALEAAGYQAVTIGPETLMGALTYLGQRKLRAITAPWYGRAAEFIPRWRAGERLGREACLCLHWTWEANNGFGALRELVSLIKPEVISWKAAGIYTC